MNTKQNPVIDPKPVKPKKNYNIRQYFQGIICDRDTRESGKKRYFWTQIIFVVLIVFLILLIFSIGFYIRQSNTDSKYDPIYGIVFGSLGVIGCIIGHYYNTKTYIENSKYDIDIDDIAAFIDIKNAIKKTINTISQNQKEIDNLNRQINIILGKNKAKEFTSSIASSTSKGLTQARQSIASSTAKGKENAKALASSIASSTSKGLTQARQSIASSTTKGKENAKSADPNKNPLLDAVMKVVKPVEYPNTNGKVSTAAGENDPQSGLPEDPNKQSVPEDPQLKTLKNQLDLAKTNLINNTDILNKQIIRYNELKEKNDDYKKIKMANQHNKNIIYNISDLYDAKSLLDNINYIQYENKDIEYETNLLNNLINDEKNIFNEYKAIINDIERIKSLNDKQNDISYKIINLTNIDFEIEYLKNLKVNNLNKYIEKFFNDIESTLIEKSDIDKYFTIIEKKNIINNSLKEYKDQLTIFNSNYTHIYNIIKEKYTNLAIEKINNIIGKDNKYSDKKVNELIEQYNKYSNKDLGDAFKKRYETIMKQLVIDFGKYVYNILGYPDTLKSLLDESNIDNKILAIQNHIKGILPPLDSSGLHKYTTLPIISQNPNAKSKDSLLEIIAAPFVNELKKAINEKTILEKVKAEAESTSNNFLVQGLTKFKNAISTKVN